MRRSEELRHRWTDGWLDYECVVGAIAGERDVGVRARVCAPSNILPHLLGLCNAWLACLCACLLNYVRAASPPCFISLSPRPRPRPTTTASDCAVPPPCGPRFRRRPSPRSYRILVGLSPIVELDNWDPALSVTQSMGIIRCCPC